MRHLVLAGAFTLALAGSAVASEPFSTPLGHEGCFSDAGDSCTFVATRDGGYTADGPDWTLTILIGDNPDDVQVYGPGNAPPQKCFLYPAGANLSVSAGEGSYIFAGNPWGEPIYDPMRQLFPCPA